MTDPATYEKLTTYCAYAERCTADVKKKLATYKVEKPEHDAYINRLKEEGFLNDERYVKSYVSAHIKKKWGKVKIKAGLSAKGIAASTIQTYLADVEEEDYQERLLKLVTDKAHRIKGDCPQHGHGRHGICNRVLCLLVARHVDVVAQVLERVAHEELQAAGVFVQQVGLEALQRDAGAAAGGQHLHQHGHLNAAALRAAHRFQRESAGRGKMP